MIQCCQEVRLPTAMCAVKPPWISSLFSPPWRVLPFRALSNLVLSPLQSLFPPAAAFTFFCQSVFWGAKAKSHSPSWASFWFVSFVQNLVPRPLYWTCTCIKFGVFEGPHFCSCVLFCVFFNHRSWCQACVKRLWIRPLHQDLFWLECRQPCKPLGTSQK